MTRRTNEAPDDIACVPRWMAQQVDGYTPSDDRTLKGVADAVEFLPEAEAESRDDVVELATYCLVYKRDPLRLFVYRRGGAGHERRLHGELSFGVGGGVERRDFRDSHHEQNGPFVEAALRELHEELSVTSDLTLSTRALLYTDEDDVSADHLAVVSTCEVEDAEVREGRKLREPDGGYWHVVGTAPNPKRVLWTAAGGSHHTRKTGGWETWSRALWNHLPDLLPMGEPSCEVSGCETEQMADSGGKVCESHFQEAMSRLMSDIEDAGNDTPQVTHTHEPDAPDDKALRDYLRLSEGDRTDPRILRCVVESLVEHMLHEPDAPDRDSIREEIRQLRQHTDQRLDALRQQVDALKGRVGGAESDLAALETDTSISAVNACRDQIDDLDARVWALEYKLGANDDRDPPSRIDTPGASEPEPEPKAGGKQVGPALHAWLENCCDHDASVDASLLVGQRCKYGYEKYGQHLHTDDGRDGLEDLRQELGDALLYAQKCKMNGRDLSEIRELVGVLAELVGREVDASETEDDFRPLGGCSGGWRVEPEGAAPQVRATVIDYAYPLEAVPFQKGLVAVKTKKGRQLLWPEHTPVRVIDKGGEQ